MPYVKIEMLAGRSEEQKAEIARIVTAALVEHAGATPSSVFVVFDDYERHNWATGGELISRRPSPAGGKT
jgi:4-oxalocrotonate tautomerase